MLKKFSTIGLILVLAAVAFAAIPNTEYKRVQMVFAKVFLDQYKATKSAATGVTTGSQGEVTRQTVKVTVAKGAFLTAGTTSDVTVTTLPANSRVVFAIAKVTEVFACSATCTTGTLSMTLGRTAGGDHYLLSFDADAAVATFGDALAEFGSTLSVATTPVAYSGGDFLASATAVSVRLTSGTGNIGSGTATNLSTGSVTFYITYEVLPI